MTPRGRQNKPRHTLQMPDNAQIGLVQVEFRWTCSLSPLVVEQTSANENTLMLLPKPLFYWSKLHLSPDLTAITSLFV